MEDRVSVFWGIVTSEGRRWRLEGDDAPDLDTSEGTEEEAPNALGPGFAGLPARGEDGYRGVDGGRGSPMLDVRL